MILTSWIFLAGESAGSVMAINSSYIADASADIIYPGLRTKMGGLHNAGNNVINFYTIKGICNNSGAISDSALISASTAIPTLSFHGTDDPYVPFDKGVLLGCYKSPVYGSICIYRQLLASGSHCVLHIKAGGAHMPPEYSPDATMSLAVVFFRQIMNGTVQSAVFLD